MSAASSRLHYRSCLRTLSTVSHRFSPDSFEFSLLARSRLLVRAAWRAPKTSQQTKLSLPFNISPSLPLNTQIAQLNSFIHQFFSLPSAILYSFGRKIHENSLDEENPVIKGLNKQKTPISAFLGHYYKPEGEFPLNRRKIEGNGKIASRAFHTGRILHTDPPKPSEPVTYGQLSNFSVGTGPASPQERALLFSIYRQMIYYSAFLKNREVVKATVRKAFRGDERDFRKAQSSLAFIRMQVPKREHRGTVGDRGAYQMDAFGEIFSVGDQARVKVPYGVYNSQGITDEQIKRHYAIQERMRFGGKHWQGKDRTINPPEIYKGHLVVRRRPG